MNPFDSIRERLGPQRDALLHHPLYQEIDRLEALHVFMELHIFAVWDFMSLLKSLQQRLSCVAIPWLPAADPSGCRLVNEIVLAEESDDDGQGGFVSHFELYRRAMIRCRAKTGTIDAFLNELHQGRPVAVALESPVVPDCARRFVQQTFRILEDDNLCAIASAFTFGREDLLPAVFQRIVDQLNIQADGDLEDFKYYLDRHIGLDSEEHGPMANQLLHSLCGSDPARWQLAEQTAIDCLEARRALWDGILDRIRAEKQRVGPH
ncbi:DUF3050 domain-containing protein [Singulisphaera sp. GP187]|uniref:DUF3050 domain-containing protein n=1 Tax=Singulisphaera sp. GP187 TaxID=1882752 RepID=UPI0009414638|nr:DUF3050 domain-containing protein [Singulisphaera sp. GP187]